MSPLAGTARRPGGVYIVPNKGCQPGGCPNIPRTVRRPRFSTGGTHSERIHTWAAFGQVTAELAYLTVTTSGTGSRPNAATRRPDQKRTDEDRYPPCVRRDHRGLRLRQQPHHAQHQGERPHRGRGVLSQCHPFYTGKQKILDSGGRVARFEKRYGKRAKGASPLTIASPPDVRCSPI